MDVQLNSEIEQLIHERLQSGLYRTANEVIEDAFDALTARERLGFETELDRRLASLERGEHVDPETLRVELRRRSEELRRQLQA